jgi:hypothetical protein
MLADWEPELVLALRVAILEAHGYRYGEVLSRLGCSAAELRCARARVNRAMASL